jgi:MipA family protein
MKCKTPSLPPPLLSLGLATTLALAAGTAQSQAFDAVRLYGAAPGKNGGVVGAAVLSGAAYPGSDQRRTQFLPLLDYQWANGWFAGVSNGVGINLSGDPQLQYGVRLTADLGRKEKRDTALRGMGDVDARLEGGGFFNYVSPSGLFATSSLRAGSGDDGKGIVLDLGAGYGRMLAPRWRVAGGAALSVANAEHLQSYFGVNAGQSVLSGYPVYTPGSGVRDARANLALTYSFDPRTSLTMALSVKRMLGDAADSPLTRKRDAASGVVALTYGF